MVAVFLIQKQIDCRDDGILKGREAYTVWNISTINLYHYNYVYILSELIYIYCNYSLVPGILFAVYFI
jgi:hypothetical protein